MSVQAHPGSSAAALCCVLGVMIHDGRFRSAVCATQIDPSNMLLLEQHVACAALETAILPGEDEAVFGSNLGPVLSSLAAAGRPADMCCLAQVSSRTSACLRPQHRCVKADVCRHIVLRWLQP
jgi:hypothetical protein